MKAIDAKAPRRAVERACGAELGARRPLVLGGATGREFIPVLKATGLIELAYAVLLAIGLFIAA